MNTDNHGKVIPNSFLTVNNTACPKCGATEFEMRMYTEAGHEGDIHCARCGEFIRRFDAG